MDLPINQIICGDCLEVMKGWPDNCVDLVLTDPPYGVNYAKWDSQIPHGWLKEACRVAKYVVFTPGNGNQHLYPEPVWTICWARPGSVQRVRKGVGFSHWEPVLVYGATNPYMVDYKKLPANTGAEKLGHPCPKPRALMYWLIKNSNTKGLVVDIFNGSGTTCVAAKMLGRDYIGIDISEEYCQIARDRIEAVEKGLTVKELKKGQRSLFE